MTLLLAGPCALEAVELDSAGDVDHAGAGPVEAIADEEARMEDLEQGGDQCGVTLAEAETVVTLSVTTGRACGK
jgi:hypothetical protein